MQLRKMSIYHFLQNYFLESFKNNYMKKEHLTVNITILKAGKIMNLW